MMRRPALPGPRACLALVVACLAASGGVLAEEVAGDLQLVRVPPPSGFRPRSAGCTSVTDLVVEEHVRSGDGVDLDEPTHLGFFLGLEVLTDHGGDRFVYRPEGGGEWFESPLDLAGPHSLTYSDTMGSYLADDSDHQRLLAFEDLGSSAAQSAVSVAGVQLHHPHDVVYDPQSGFSYALDATGPVLFRLRDLGVGEAFLDLSSVAGYSRALTLVDGRLHVVASSLGRVVEVVDFDSGSVDVHQSFGFRQEAYAGSWDTTGLILNDVEWYRGAWYASSFFAPPWAGGTDHNRFKLIRFRTWSGFESGAWDELSPFLPDAVVPYFFTVHDGSLYLATFHTQLLGGDTVYRLRSALFACNLECGDLACWSAVEPAR
jgi:hypothetical protein